MRGLLHVFAVLVLAVAVPSAAEILHADKSGFVSAHTLTLAAPPERAYEALTDEVAQWWDATHSYGGTASGFSLDATALGCFCESLPDGGSVAHMQVVFAQPGVRLRMLGGLGPLQSLGVSGSMDFSFTPTEEGGSVLEYRYQVGGYLPEGLDQWANAVDQVQLGQLKRLQAYLESGEALNVANAAP